jgi:hypothetical protein
MNRKCEKDPPENNDFRAYYRFHTHRPEAPPDVLERHRKLIGPKHEAAGENDQITAEIELSAYLWAAILQLALGVLGQLQDCFLNCEVFECNCEVFECNCEVFECNCEVFECNCEVFECNCEVFECNCEVFECNCVFLHRYIEGSEGTPLRGEVKN